MRSIQVSTPVFAAIWAAHVEGEDSEDTILARLLKVPIKVPEQMAAPPEQAAGFSDAKYGFRVSEGFEIFRRFRGVEFRARASRSKWVLEKDGKSYSTLAELSEAVGARGENAWSGWSCRNFAGKIVAVGTLRSPDAIQRRQRVI